MVVHCPWRRRRVGSGVWERSVRAVWGLNPQLVDVLRAAVATACGFGGARAVCGRGFGVEPTAG